MSRHGGIRTPGVTADRPQTTSGPIGPKRRAPFKVVRAVEAEPVCSDLEGGCDTETSGARRQRYRCPNQYPEQLMIRIIREPVRIAAHGSPPKQIEEYVGRPSTSSSQASLAPMLTPTGRSEPGQTPDLDEMPPDLRGVLVVQ